MSLGLITIDLTIAGVTQFVDASAVVTFAEVTVSSLVDENVRIRGFSYNSAGASHEVSLVLTRPGVATGTSADIVLVAESGINSFARFCDVIVPREYGIIDTSQPPLVQSTGILPYTVFFSTTGKTGNGTFILWYDFFTP